MTALPAVFITHGSPTMPLDPCPARDFFAGLGGLLPRPRAILCLSAHWESQRPGVSAHPEPPTIHDFYGFPEDLHRMQYPAPGAPDLAVRVGELLDGAGPGCDLDPDRGLDHGAWAPLRLAWPEADIPVAQLSVQTRLGPQHHLDLGRALRPLREEGVLLLASGSATHNLRDFGRYPLDAPPVPYAAAFAAWLDDAVACGDRRALAAALDEAPEARRNHPSPEHYYPLLVAAGAGADDRGGDRLHDSYTYGVFYMGAWSFA